MTSKVKSSASLQFSPQNPINSEKSIIIATIDLAKKDATIRLLPSVLANMWFDTSERLPVIAGLWHEAVADRKAVEVTGAILKLLSAPQLPSDVCSELVVWLDNCGGQNKSYVLFQTLHNAVRSGVIKFDSLTLKYFVPGHSLWLLTAPMQLWSGSWRELEQSSTSRS